MRPSGASATLGRKLRSTKSTGRCHSRSTTCGPQSFWNSLPRRGPTPLRSVTSAKRGLRIAGRTARRRCASDLELQQPPRVAIEQLFLVGGRQLQFLERPFGARRIRHERVIDREHDAVEAHLLDAIVESVIGEEAAGRDVEIAQEFLAE